MSEYSTEEYMAEDRTWLTRWAIDFLDNWQGSMDSKLSQWREEYLPRGFPFDFSLESLDVLESALLERYPNRASVKSNENAGFTEGAVRYIGETWRRNCPSRWLIHDNGPSDQSAYNRVPLIYPNAPEEHSQAIVPLHTLVAFSVDREPLMLREMIFFLEDSIKEAEESE